MHAWEQIQETIEFIEEYLSEDIRIDSLAEMVALSPFYYQRLFSRLVKKPLSEYIKLRRMAKATEALLQKEQRILDVALELGFSSHEHFTRTLKDTFGMTPKEYRRNPQTLSRMTKPELLLHYTLVDEGVPLITEGIVLEVNRRWITMPSKLAFQTPAPMRDTLYILLVQKPTGHRLPMALPAGSCRRASTLSAPSRQKTSRHL